MVNGDKHNVYFFCKKQHKCVCARSNPLVDKSKHIPLKGCIKTLKNLFYPDYEYSKANIVIKGKASRKELSGDKEDRKHHNTYKKKNPSIIKKHMFNKATGKLNFGKVQQASKRFGNKIENQFDNTLVWFLKINCSHKTFWDSVVRLQASRLIHDDTQRNIFNKLCKGMHSYTQNIWGLLWKYCLRPVATQVVCGWKELGHGVCLDLLCEEFPSGRRVGVELKMKYSYKNHSTGEYMNAPFDHLLDAPINHHYLQSLFTWILYDHDNGFSGRTTTIKPLEQYYILRIDDAGGDMDPIPSNVLSCRQIMLTCIQQNTRNRNTSKTSITTSNKKK